MKTKTLVIVNPISGVGRQKKIETTLKENLNHDLYDYTVVYTEHIHHGRDLAREAAAEGLDCVVAVGGDGSVNDVVQGLRGSDTRLGIIPCGSGNGLARSLKIPLQPALAVRCLNQQYQQTIDTITVNDRWVVANAAGVGFDAYISKIMQKAKTRGLPAYTNLILREYANYKESVYRLKLDGRTVEREAWFIAVANSRQFGYNLAVAPKAKLDDGLIDISIIDKVPLDHMPISLPLAFSNHLDLSQHVEMFRTKEVVIEGNTDKWVNLDGEAENVGTTVHFVNMPQSLKIFGRDPKHPLREMAPTLERIKERIER